jgi:hypothetical protein
MIMRMSGLTASPIVCASISPVISPISISGGCLDNTTLGAVEPVVKAGSTEREPE